MNNYKDRGIVKWAPFDALNGHSSAIEELLINLGKKEIAALSDDEYEELNLEVEKALKNNAPLNVEYYNDGYTYQTYGKIKKLDTINKILVLETEEKIEFDSIIKMKVSL